MYADSFSAKDYWSQFQGKNKGAKTKEDKETIRLREDLERVKKSCLKLGGGDFKVRTKNDQYKTTQLDIIGGGSLEKTVSEEHKRADKAVHDFMKKSYVTIGKQHAAVEEASLAAKLPVDNSTAQDSYKWPPKHDYEPVADFKNRNKKLSIPFAGKDLKQRLSHSVQSLNYSSPNVTRSQFINPSGDNPHQLQHQNALNVKAALQNKERVERSNFSLAMPIQIRTSSVSPAQLYRSMRASASALASYTVKNEQPIFRAKELQRSLEIETKPEFNRMDKKKDMEPQTLLVGEPKPLLRTNKGGLSDEKGQLMKKNNSMTHSLTDLRLGFNQPEEEPLMDFKKTNFCLGLRDLTTLGVKSSSVCEVDQKERYAMGDREDTQNKFKKNLAYGKTSKFVLGRESSEKTLNTVYKTNFTWKVPRFAV